ncbi:MAG TPA: S9 family peptidase, partial [Nitrososphaerales archaeon]|nr:S9 family peptidase [Nitrososphaerales archaeon]
PGGGGSQPAQVEDVDRNKANTLNSDVRTKPHGPTRIVWEEEFIYYLQAEGGAVHLLRLKPGKEAELVIGGERSVEGFDVKRGGVAFVAMDSHHPEELYVKEGSERTLTSLNSDVQKELDLIPPKDFSFTASDGVRIEGWVLPPALHPARAKSPAILYVHGGPKTAFGYSFMHELQFYAASGFAVICTNPRGSDGYTEEFADIRGEYGNRDFKDLMEALDHVIQNFSFVDGARVAIAGGSYGGFMTNWAIGHTDRFRAAVTDRSIASWVSFFGTSDIGTYFTEDQMGGEPWADEEKLLALSPLRYAKNVKTPLLVVHSFEDYRCWMVEGLQFYTALKYLGREAEMVLFPGENHDLSRTGKPKHRVARLKYYLGWFEKHLKAGE